VKTLHAKGSAPYTRFVTKPKAGHAPAARVKLHRQMEEASGGRQYQAAEAKMGTETEGHQDADGDNSKGPAESY
jgi:hypothetical protein